MPSWFAIEHTSRPFVPSRYMRLETHAYRARGGECAKEDAFTQLKNRNGSAGRPQEMRERISLKRLKRLLKLRTTDYVNSGNS